MQKYAVFDNTGKIRKWGYVAHGQAHLQAKAGEKVLVIQDSALWGRDLDVQCKIRDPASDTPQLIKK